MANNNTVIIMSNGNSINSTDGWKFGIILNTTPQKHTPDNLANVELYAALRDEKTGSISGPQKIIATFLHVDAATHALKSLWSSIVNSDNIWNVKDMPNQTRTDT